MPTLPGYRMDVSRVTADAEAGVVVAELTETVEVDGGGRIPSIEVFTRRA